MTTPATQKVDETVKEIWESEGKDMETAQLRATLLVAGQLARCAEAVERITGSGTINIEGI